MPRSKPRSKPRSQSARADLKFSVSRVRRHLRRDHNGLRVGRTTPVYLTAVLEYLVAEVLEGAAAAAAARHVKRVTPQHIQQAIRGDIGELDLLLTDVHMNRGGVISSLPPRKRSSKAAVGAK